MKKVLMLTLTGILMLSTAVTALAETKLTFNGEGNFGYDFSKKSYNGHDGANFADYTLAAKAVVNNNVTLYSELKNTDLGGSGFKLDEAWAYLQFAPLNVKVGYYGFGISGKKDILEAALSSDLKSNVGIQADTMIAGKICAMVYYGTRSSSDDDYDYNFDEVKKTDVQEGVVNEDNTFAVRFEYNMEKYGMGLAYGQTDWTYRGYNQGAVFYSLFGYYSPIKDLKTYLDCSNLTAENLAGTTETSLEDTDIIVGALYTPANSPLECRLEYDLSEKNPSESEKFNPWGIRLGYKLNPNTKIELESNELGKGVKENSVTLNLSF